MKVVTVVVVLSFLVVPVQAAQGADGLKDRVGQCEMDNEGAKVPPDVIRAYCLCMSGKMGGAEAVSITEWEKTRPKEREECDQESGWATR